MKLNTHFLLSFVLGMLFCLPNGQAQLVNMEETWQEFLKNKKTSHISELVKPEKTQPQNYIKYSLIYANKYFCADNFRSAQEMMDEIEAMGKKIWDDVDGFESRYEGLKIKMDAYKSLVPVWDKFMNDRSSVSIEDVENVPEAKTVCEKGTLCKYFYMITYNHYCAGDLEEARALFDERVRRLVNTTWDHKGVDGIGDEVDKMLKLWAGIDELNPAWEAFIHTDISPGMKADLPEYDCYTIPNIKAYILKGAANICEEGEKMLQKAQRLQRKSTHSIPSDVIRKIEWLEAEVDKFKKDLNILNTFWDKFVQDGDIPPMTSYEHSFVCDREGDVRAYIMDGLSDPCMEGPKALETIKQIRKEYKPALSNSTTTKLKLLQEKAGTGSGDVVTLNKAWEYFLENDEVSEEYEYDYEFSCDRELDVKAYLLDGYINPCQSGQYGLDQAAKVRAEHNPDLSEETLSYIQELKDRIASEGTNVKAVTRAWEDFAPDNELDGDIDFVFSYCDKIAECRAFLIDGTINLCRQGQKRLDDISKIQEDYLLTFDNTMDEKYEKLHELVKNMNGGTEDLDSAWELCLKHSKLTKVKDQINIKETYCDNMAQVKAWIIKGQLVSCKEGEKYLDKIDDLKDLYDLSYDKEISHQIEQLAKRVKKCR